MRIHTTSGLHGTLIDLVTIREASENETGIMIALVKRDNPVYGNRAYSTHRLYEQPGSGLVAEAGHYDLTLDDARVDLAERAGRTS